MRHGLYCTVPLCGLLCGLKFADKQLVTAKLAGDRYGLPIVLREIQAIALQGGGPGCRFQKGLSSLYLDRSGEGSKATELFFLTDHSFGWLRRCRTAQLARAECQTSHPNKHGENDETCFAG